MPTGFTFFDHTADVGVHVTAPTLPALFTQAGHALFAAMGELPAAGPARSRTIDLSANDLADLLHDFLSELLFAFATDCIRHTDFEFTELSPHRLTATARGATVDFARARPRAEIKAVTYHQLTVAQQPDGTWQATVIFDV